MIVRSFALAAILASANTLTVQAGGYVAPVIPRIVAPTDIATPTANSGWWVFGGIVVVCLLICFQEDDDGKTTVIEPRPPIINPEPPVEPPSPVPLGQAGGFLVSALAAFGAIRRRGFIATLFRPDPGCGYVGHDPRIATHREDYEPGRGNAIFGG